MVKGVGHLGHDEAMEAGGREFEPRPAHYSRMSLFQAGSYMCVSSTNSEFIWNVVLVGKQ